MPEIKGSDLATDPTMREELDGALKDLKVTFEKKKENLRQRSEEVTITKDKKKVFQTKIDALDESLGVVENARHTLKISKVYPQASHPQALYSISSGVERDLRKKFLISVSGCGTLVPKKRFKPAVIALKKLKLKHWGVLVLLVNPVAMKWL